MLASGGWSIKPLFYGEFVLCWSGVDRVGRRVWELRLGMREDGGLVYLVRGVVLGDGEEE
jgi:hypothetical protein